MSLRFLLSARKSGSHPLLSLHRSAKKWANASFIYLIAGFFEIPFATNFLGSVLPYVYLAALLAYIFLVGRKKKSK